MISVIGDSLAALAPHMDGEGCSTMCCQAARQNKHDRNQSKLRCIVECSQPGQATTPSPLASFIEPRHHKINADLPTIRVQAALAIGSTINNSRNNLNTPSNTLYLKTGSLLI